jgi:hypothetical protein
MVFGIDLTHPGGTELRLSKAAMVGSLDLDFCRCAHFFQAC